MRAPAIGTLVAVNVHRIRGERRLTQAALAERAELTTHYIALIESGEKQPKLATLAKIAKALDVPAAELLRAAEQADDAWARRVKRAAEHVPVEAREFVLQVLEATVRYVVPEGREVKVADGGVGVNAKKK